ncbi:hypothetical protein [Streptomyces sp. RerS4]|uniref:hypothetical protein n=1 Tax=Streptomyces sp. RerS4 TaxID=2942449 RepID=UPI00201C16DA|nr:hypothetical protein [Streptomyces sp. RerS4]UQX02833.1 hypothetical protein M4D82_21815 [Streptomyces sp. RerS4]
MTSNPSTPDNDGPKTETTLTTRIRINIPGSRPIPPVVVRKPVKGGASAGGPAAAPASADRPAPRRTLRPRPPRPYGPPCPRAPPPVPGAGRPAPPANAGPDRQGQSEPPAGGWFAPRKATPPPASAPRRRRARAAAPPCRRSPAAPAARAAPAGLRAPAAPGHPQPPAAHGTGAGFAPAPSVGGPGVGGPQGDPAPAYDSYDGYDAGPRRRPSRPSPTPPGRPAGPRWAPFRWAPRSRRAGRVPRPRPSGTALPAPSRRRPRCRRPPPGPQPPRQDRPVPAPPAPAGKGAKGSKGGKKTAKATNASAPAGSAKSAKPAKKGRSKLALLGGGLVALVGVAYGAGLLMNHSDVPKGTTVLGVDIGGTREEAVTKLQKAFGDRASAPLPLTVGGKQVELKPDKAGLTLDSQTTVRNAAGSDYNPVTVIGSLFGVERTAEAVMPADEEKLRVALQEAAGGAGSSSEGTIKFDTGKAVAVPGKAGTGLDVDASVDQVIKAFREFVASGKAPAVELPTTTKEPTVTQAELDRAMKEFAEPAMSAPAIVKAGGKSLPFGAKSLPKILSMTVVDGRLVEKYDLEALKATYGNTFDGVLITRGTGAKTPVTPQDVAGALGKALVGKTTAERTVTIDTNAS